MPPEKDVPIVLSVDAMGRYYLNVAAKPTDPINERELYYRVAALLALAEEQHIHRPVYVKGDRQVDYGKVVSAMSLLQKAGAQDVGLITDPQ